MNFKSYKEIILSYANSRGKGLPLTAEEYCNAIALYIQEVLTEFGEEFDQKTSNLLMNAVTQSVSASEEVARGVAESVARTTAQEEVVQKVLYGNLIQGSDTIVVDLNETADGLEVHLDGEVVAILQKAITTPLSAPSEPSVPVVSTNNSVSYEPLSSLGGGTKLYKHELSFLDGNRLTIISTYEGQFNDISDIDISRVISVYYAYDNFYCHCQLSLGYNLTSLYVSYVAENTGQPQVPAVKTSVFPAPIESDTVTPLN